MPKIKRGDIYYADLGTQKGSVQGGTRPVIVVQNNKGNTHSPVITVIPLTTSKNKGILPTHTIIPSSCGLSQDSIALCEQINTINKNQIKKYIGYCPSYVMQKNKYLHIGSNWAHRYKNSLCNIKEVYLNVKRRYN